MYVNYDLKLYAANTQYLRPIDTYKTDTADKSFKTVIKLKIYIN